MRCGRPIKKGVARYTPNPALLAIHGKIDGLVLRSDGVILPCPQPDDPRTPLQRGARARIKLVSKAWQDLSPEVREGWARYAGLAQTAGVGGKGGRDLRPFDAFCGTACKYLQLHGGTEFPTQAPERPFLGDALAVRAEGIEGGVRFVANGGNGPLAVTELRLQSLKNAARTPQADKYRTRAFTAFAEGTLEAVVPAKPGAYAAAVRYLIATTGQASRLVPLGTVVVTGG